MHLYELVGGVSDDVVYFFFQAEDGIRDVAVTGVQTCALPISSSCTKAASSSIQWKPLASSANCFSSNRRSFTRISFLPSVPSRVSDRESGSAKTNSNSPLES